MRAPMAMVSSRKYKNPRSWIINGIKSNGNAICEKWYDNNVLDVYLIVSELLNFFETQFSNEIPTRQHIVDPINMIIGLPLKEIKAKYPGRFKKVFPSI